MGFKTEYILCAAIKRLVPKDTKPYHEGTNDICNIEIGYRHHDIYQRFEGEVSKKNKDQGFYTSKGRFVDRYEGMMIAYMAGQVSEKKARDKSYLKNNDIQFINVIEDPEDDKCTSKYRKEYNQLFSEDLY